ILHGADRAFLVECARGLRDRSSCVNGFCRDDAVVALRQLSGIVCSLKARGKFRSAGNAQAARLNGGDVLLPDVVGPDFGFTRLRQMRGEDAADGPTTNDADSHSRITPTLAEWAREIVRWSRLMRQFRKRLAPALPHR